MTFIHYEGSYGFLKYKKPLLLIFIAYLVLTVIVCSWTNFNNDLLEKKTGVIEYIKINAVPDGILMWYVINIKLKEDPVIYVQEWHITNHVFFYYFLFGRKDFSEMHSFKSGSRVEFYIDKNPKSYIYILTNRIQSKNGKMGYHSEKTPEDITTVLSYGLKINERVVLNYRKRDFATTLYIKMQTGLALLSIPLVLIGVACFIIIWEKTLDMIFNFLKIKKHH